MLSETFCTKWEKSELKTNILVVYTKHYLNHEIHSQKRQLYLVIISKWCNFTT
jgi:hypothetical protein